MKTRFLIVISIVLASIGLGSFAYALSVQIKCESLLGDTHYPRPLTLWNCLDYLNMINENIQATSSELIDTFKEKYSNYEIMEYTDSQEIPWKYSVSTGSSDVELIFGDERTILRSYGTPDGDLICTVINPFPKDILDSCPPKW